MSIDVFTPLVARDHHDDRRARPIEPSIPLRHSDVDPIALGPDHAPDAPYVDDDDLLRRGDAWCALAPIEAAIVRVLLERGPRVVTRREIGARAWPDGMPTGRPVDGRLSRLRRRLAPLGLRIHTVRRRGLLLTVEPIGGGRTG